MVIKKCKQCDTVNPDLNQFCIECGSSLEPKLQPVSISTKNTSDTKPQRTKGFFGLGGILTLVIFLGVVLAGSFSFISFDNSNKATATAQTEARFIANANATTTAQAQARATSTVQAQLPTATVLGPLGLAELSYSTDLYKWNINYYQPQSIDLSETSPNKNWKEPPSKGQKRLYGILTFGEKTKVNVILDELDDVESQMYFTFNEDVNFNTKRSYKTTKGSLEEPIEFQIDYGNGNWQKYTISIYYPIDFSREIGKYRLHYYRDSIRQGVVNLEGVNYPVAIADESATGSYSKLDQITLFLDANQDGNISKNEKTYANSSFMVNGDYYRVENISSDGSQLKIRKAQFGTVNGRVLNATTKAPIADAKLLFYPLNIAIITGSFGNYSVKLPEGKYWQIATQHTGYIPEFTRIDITVNSDQSYTQEILLPPIPPNVPLRGTLRLSGGDSYHFLSGKKDKYSGGDFYLGFSDKVPKFFANNMYERGVVDVGDMSNNPLEQVNPPSTGYTQFGVVATVGHTYVSQAKEGEEGHYIIFRVTYIKPEKYIDIEYYYL